MTLFNLSFGFVFASEYKVELLDENNGFATSIIFSIVQDKDGFLWFGTGYEGLIRYDGKDVVRYQNKANDPNSLPHKNAGNLTLDKYNNIWIGSWGGGAIKYEQTTGKFKQYQHDVDDPSSISANSIQHIFEDQEGDIWFGTRASGLNKFNPKQQNFTRYPNVPNTETSLPSDMSSDRIWDITQTTAGSLWSGTDHGLVNFDKTSETFARFVPNPESENKGHNKIRNIIEGPDNQLFLGTDDGVLSFDQSTRLFSPLKIHNYSSIGSVYSIIKTNFNQYWATSTRGVFSFSDDNLTLKKVELGFDDQSSQTLYQDRQGVIWLTCEGVGVYKIVRKNNFKLYNNPIAKSAYSLFATEADHLLIGTADRGIHKWNTATNQLTVVNVNPDQVNQSAVRKMTQTSNGDIWFINDHSVFKIDSEGKQQQVFASFTTPKFELFDNFKEIIVDSDDTIWIGTKNGVFAIHDLAADFEYISLNGSTSNLGSRGNVTSLDYIANNQIWIGTSTGLNLWNTLTKELKIFSVSDKQIISNDLHNFIYTTYQDKSQRFWVSTMTGLYLFDKETGNFSIYSDYFLKEENLAIRFIKEDEVGDLWFFTPLGVSRLSPDSGRMQHFDKADGLSGSRYFIDLVTQTSNGNIFLSSRDGIHHFAPSTIPEIQLDTKILLTNFEVLGSPKKRLQKHIKSTNIDLAYDQNYLKFEFATPDFLRARQIKYYYKLEGFDTDWVKNGNNNTAVYTNLNGGDFTFRVRAEYKNNLWYEHELAIKVHIATPFWKQWWMYIIYTCLFLLAVYYYIHRQKQSVLKLERQVAEKTASIELKSNKLAAANKVKSQFLANMSHEIRTPLTTVIGQAEAIICRDIDSANIYREVEVIHDNGLHLLALLNDILDLTKIEENKFELELQTQDLHELLEVIHRMFSIEARSKGLSFQTTKQLPVPFVINIDGLRVKQILINLCSNAIKFTQQGHISFDITLKNSELVFTITDTGIGMLTEQTQQIFESFTQADASISRRFGGTGLGLSLSDQLARLMDGNIKVESEYGRGTVCTFSMPLPSLPESNNLNIDDTSYDFSTPDTLFSGTILLAEDHFDNRRFIERLLKKLGLTVITAGDGLEVIELYSKHSPDVILLDIQMPKVDGIQAYKTLRKLGCDQPIIAFTANAMSHDVEYYRSLGFNELLKKPLNRQELIATIAKYFPIQSTEAQVKANDTLGNVDMSDLVLEFKASLVTEYKQFLDYAENRELEKLAAQAHRLIGASQIFGFPKLADAATKLENSIKNDNLEQLDSLIQTLLNELNNLK